MSSVRAPEAPDRVLPTLNPDGTRRWLSPRPAPGRFLTRRRALGWTLIALFTLLPYVRIGGKPAILLDVVTRRFTFFGTTFFATDTVLLMLLLVGIFLGIFLVTAVWGRVWCGWGCPQTVYMEFVYRPLERLFERRAAGWPPALRRAARYAAYLVVSMLLAHTFLAYFVSVDRLRHWVTRSPAEHPVAFLVMAATTALMLVDFAWFREQTCMVACPYGRLQSVLLDRRSLIVGYDGLRGEPRGRARERRASRERIFGDCIDCHACVAVCPTGIDIRDGLQMECIHCAQCIDACDAIARRAGFSPGLIRYGSRAEFAGEPRRFLRPRIVLYPLLLLAVWGALAVALVRRAPAEVTVLRAPGSPFTVLPSGEVSNTLRVRIVNRGHEEQRYRIEIADDGVLRLVAPESPLRVAPGETATTVVFVTAPPVALPAGRRDIRLRVTDGAGFDVLAPSRLLGPTS